MTDPRLPSGFAITPYHGEAAADPGQSARPLRDRVRVACWLVAAGLAAAAAWARVYELTQTFPTEAGSGYLWYSFDGWGRDTVRTSLDFSPGSLTGSNFGVLLCAAAAGLLVGAAADWFPRRLRWQPSGSTVAGLATAFLLAIVLCEVVTTLPSRRAAQQGGNSVFHFGLSPWLGGVACLVAALGCLPLPFGRPKTVGDDAFRRT